MINAPNERLSCSAFSDSVGEPLAGTVDMWTRCVCIQVPLPWKRNLLQSRFFQEHQLSEDLILSVKKRIPGLKILGIVSDKHKLDGFCRILSFRYIDNQWVKSSYIFPESTFHESFLLFLEDEENILVQCYREITEIPQDYLVCTHGSRDSCCGFWGYRLYMELDEAYSSENVRFWRASHLGGDRFAPSVVSFDDARYWGRVSSSDFVHIINRGEDLVKFGGMYRGKATSNSLEEQLIERELFNVFGWDLDQRGLYPRLLKDYDSGSDYIVDITTSKNSDEIHGRYLVKIQKDAMVPQYGCIPRPVFRSRKISKVVELTVIR